jgi:hypothetical protein
MDRVCSSNGEENTYRILVGKPEGKSPLGIPKHFFLNLCSGGWNQCPLDTAAT